MDERKVPANNLYLSRILLHLISERVDISRNVFYVKQNLRRITLNAANIAAVKFLPENITFFGKQIACRIDCLPPD
jgi:hypothetical protein